MPRTTPLLGRSVGASSAIKGTNHRQPQSTDAVMSASQWPFVYSPDPDTPRPGMTMPVQCGVDMDPYPVAVQGVGHGAGSLLGGQIHPHIHQVLYMPIWCAHRGRCVAPQLLHGLRCKLHAHIDGLGLYADGDAKTYLARMTRTVPSMMMTMPVAVWVTAMGAMDRSLRTELKDCRRPDQHEQLPSTLPTCFSSHPVAKMWSSSRREYHRACRGR